MRALLLVGLLTLLVASLRLPGTRSGLPQASDPDKVFVTQALRLEERANGRTERAVSELYPHLLGHLLEAWPGALAESAESAAPIEEHLEAARRPYRTGRLLSGLLSLLVVPAAYLLARSRLGMGPSLLAAAFAGTSLLGVLLAHQARPHAALCAFLAWTLVGAQRFAVRPSIGHAALLALAFGLAVSTLHNGAAAGPAVAVACFFAWRESRRQAMVGLLLIAAGALTALLFAYPFIIDGGLWGGRSFEGKALDGSGFLRSARTLALFEPTLVVLSLFTLLPPRKGTARQKLGPCDWVLIAFAVPYVVAIGLYHSTWHRFSLPLVPLLSMTAAVGASKLAVLLGLRGGRALVAGLALIVFPTVTAARYSWLWTLPQSTDQMAEWIEDNLDPTRNQIHVSFGVDLPLVQMRGCMAKTQRAWRSPWQQYQLQGNRVQNTATWRLWDGFVPIDERADPANISSAEVLQGMSERRVTHALVLVPGKGSRLESDGTLAAVRELEGRLLVRFAPYESASLSGTTGSGGADQLGFEPISIALRAERLGPVLELYELPKGVWGRGGQR